MTVPEVRIFLEVPGKRGRELGERRTIQEHAQSIEKVRGALGELGYRQNEKDWSWEIPGS